MQLHVQARRLDSASAAPSTGGPAIKSLAVWLERPPEFPQGPCSFSHAVLHLPRSGTHHRLHLVIGPHAGRVDVWSAYEEEGCVMGPAPCLLPFPFFSTVGYLPRPNPHAPHWLESFLKSERYYETPVRHVRHSTRRHTSSGVASVFKIHTACMREPWLPSLLPSRLPNLSAAMQGGLGETEDQNSRGLGQQGDPSPDLHPRCHAWHRVVPAKGFRRPPAARSGEAQSTPPPPTSPPPTHPPNLALWL